MTASIGPTQKPPFVLAAWREKLAALGAEDFLPYDFPDELSVQREAFGADEMGRSEALSH